MDVAGALKTMRERAGFSQEKMGEHMLASKSTISRMESGKIALKFHDVLRWCKITDNPEAWMALYAAFDIAAQVTPLTQMITGFIRLGGFI
ncbi:helix-turn-helix domain-containing protein [Oceanobacillus sojae]|uniref:HTH cro/C1-type domain-containing protein n=1 Tax=Oceanobacillus sojae TaxID=582851 RepID=A0A511ZIE8_9BACI|nr:helix-turn-helix transcriptional regulator [Oceanobacillus sojae]GEN87207.1 hypothetical protein OSO01_19460 [Oceanobacillus sojae]